SRAPARLRLATDWKVHRALLEQQLEFLRHLIESPRFRAAVDEVLRNPHGRLEEDREERSISQPFKAGRDFVRQVAMSARRHGLPDSHSLRQTNPKLVSLPSDVSIRRKSDFL